MNPLKFDEQMNTEMLGQLIEEPTGKLVTIQLTEYEDHVLTHLRAYQHNMLLGDAAKRLRKEETLSKAEMDELLSFFFRVGVLRCDWGGYAGDNPAFSIVEPWEELPVPVKAP